VSSKTTGQRAIDLNELGWRCVHDSHYAPALNSDAGPLFKLYPRLYQRHGPGIWCTAPGLAALAAYRKLLDAEAHVRDAAAAIASCFTDAALIALCDANETNQAAAIILAAAREELNIMTQLLTTREKDNDSTGI
jgi:hypothetical protein